MTPKGTHFHEPSIRVGLMSQPVPTSINKMSDMEKGATVLTLSTEILVGCGNVVCLYTVQKSLELSLYVEQ